MQSGILSVRQLNLYVRSLLEGDPRLVNVTVTGEISNFKNHYSSGHWYFTLKDSEAAIRCVMFRANASSVKFMPCDGLQVVLRGRVSLYERDGQYQLYAEEMSPAGLGDITLQFEQVKARLEAEGMFDTATKRPLPSFPKRIAVVTSPTGAAVRDILNILGRRWPLAEVLLCPVSVQGELAVPEMLNTLEKLYAFGAADLIIIGRGGGSIEDLWAFNSEELARKIYESPIPIISAVGHETDFTICDFVADLRAPTPSAAAELAVPDIKDITELLSKYSASLKNSLNSKYKLCTERFLRVQNEYCYKKPDEAIISDRSIELDNLCDRLLKSLGSSLNNAQLCLSKSAAALDALSPLKVLSRGYSAVEKNGNIVTHINQLKANDKIKIKLSDGAAECTVDLITEEREN